MDIVKNEFVDVQLVGGELVARVPVKKVVLNALNPILEKLKEKIPGTWDDALIDALKKEIEEYEFK